MSTLAPARLLPIREITLILLGSMALFLFLAIGSYSPEDPGFSFASPQSEARNLVGVTGAYFADLVLYLFGFVAFLIPLSLAFAGARLLFTQEVSWLVFAVRLSGWIALTVASCVVLELHLAVEQTFPAGDGGIFGQWLVSFGVPVFGIVGLTVIALTLFLVGFQASTGMSWLDIAEYVGRALHGGTAWVVHQIQTVQARWLERRHQQEIHKFQAARLEKKAVVKPKPERTTPEIKPVVKTAPKPAKVRQKSLFKSESLGELPDLDLLDERSELHDLGYSAESLEAMSRQLELKLADFGVEAEVVSVLPGPVVTRFELQPAPGVKVQKISALAKDLARSMAVISVRIVEVIPGKSVVGIEIPNEHREMVQLKEVITSDSFQNASSPLTLALGKDIAGATIVANIEKMPHLLVAGTTGSGKSVGVNAMLLSILCKSTPDEVRLILVDPKMLELSVYEGIPHLLAPVVTDMKEAAHALNWCVAEMERRYRLMAALGVRNLSGYNRQVKEAKDRGEPILDPLWTQEDEPPPELVH